MLRPLILVGLLASSNSWSWHTYRSSASVPSKGSNRPISYPGGFEPDGRHCMDICVHSDPIGPVCFNETEEEASCQAKEQTPGDWDYLLLGQIFLPEFCRGLDRGIDDTVSHQNVDIYPKGTHCLMHRTPPELTIHGLWPNYWNGYPTCCRQDPGHLNVQVDPYAFAQSYPSLLSRIDKEWRDPTTESGSDVMCEILNHEWQKHGYCLGYRLDAQDSNESAQLYFSFTLRIVEQIQEATASLNLMALSGVTPSVAEIQALYPRRVNLYCSVGAAEGGVSTKHKDKKDEEVLNHLLAVRSCWGRPEEGYCWQDEGAEMWDCHLESEGYGNQMPCDETKLVSLLPYISPGGIDGPHGMVSEA